jgi:hypothetical protein
VDLTGGLAVVVLTNAPGDSPVAVTVARAAISLARAAADGGRLPDLPPADRRFVPDPQALIGRYGEGDTGIEVRSEPDGLVLVSGEGHAALYDAGAGRLACDSPSRRLFHQRCIHEDGIRWWTGGAAASPPLSTAWEAFVGRYRSFTPWFPSFRIVPRRGRLHLVAAQGTEAPGDEPELVPLDDSLFRVGADPRLPERIKFGPVVDGRCISAELDGCLYSRSFAP